MRRRSSEKEIRRSVRRRSSEQEIRRSLRRQELKRMYGGTTVGIDSGQWALIVYRKVVNTFVVAGFLISYVYFDAKLLII